METRSHSSRLRLRRLVEEAVSDELDLDSRGLRFAVNELEALGHSPERIRVWATLHFLPKGSPFFCQEPGCHLGLWGERKDRVSDSIRRRLGLGGKIELDFVYVVPNVQGGAVFDDVFHGRTAVPAGSDLNATDALGRTFLLRAVMRGYAEQVQELLEAGADVSIPDADGVTVVDLARSGRTTPGIAALLEEALKAAGRSGPSV